MDKQSDEMKSENHRGRAPAERRWRIAAQSLANKIIAPILVVAGLFVILFAVQLNNWIGLKETLRESHNRLIKSSLLSLNLSRLEERSRTILLSYRFRPSPRLLATFQRINSEVQRTSEGIERHLSTPRGFSLLAAYRTHRKEYYRLSIELIDSINSGDQESVARSFKKLMIRDQQTRASQLDLVAYNHNEIARSLKSIQAATTWELTFAVGFSFLFLGAVLFLLVYFPRVITRPIQRLTRSADRIAQGDLETEVEMCTNDEIGQLARSFQIMTGHLVHDITKRKRSEEELRCERDFAESLIVTAQAIVLVLDPEGRIVRFNPFMEQISGYRLEEVQGEDWFTTFLPERDWSRIKEVFSRAVSDIQTRGNINSIITRDGQTRYISWNDKTLKNTDGNTVGLLSIGHDITDSRRAEAALRDREQQLGLILASTAEGIFGMDLERKCTFANRSCVELLGYEDEKELLRQDMHALIHHTRSDGRPHPKEECLMYQACQQNKVVYLDDEVLWRADGGSFPAEGRSYPMIRDGQIVGTVVSFTDITERKEKEAQLLQAQKMKVVGQLTGGIAHDFNNLLTVILGNLELLADEIASHADASINELIDDAFSAARDGAELTHRLLAFSRKQTLQVKRVDINELFSNIRRLLQRTLREDIELIINRAKDVPPVLVDPGQFENALLNLVLNARDAMPGGGTLIIETTRKCIGPDEAATDPELAPGNYVLIAVSDSGIGMSAENAARAIEPFFTTKGHGGGSGLGLSMVYGFTKQSGGGLLLRSVLGEGTTVSVLVPEAASAVEKDQAEPTPLNLPDGSETILLVEDELRVRKLAKRALLKLGYRVLEAEDAAGAMKTLEDGVAVDLLFSDIVMPGNMNGRMLARWVLQRRRGLKALLTTGFSEEEAGECSVANGEVHLLKKPYTKEELATAVRAVLDAE